MDRPLSSLFSQKLLHFFAVYESGNMRQAAQDIAISQPALSKSLKGLEDQLDVQLFIRSKTGMTPTEAGDALARHFTRLTDVAREAEIEMSAIRGNDGGIIRIGAGQMWSWLFTPKALARMLRRQMGDAGPRADVEAVARALDIDHIRLDVFDGFEGMLLTDAVRSSGVILANTRRGPRRARFTVAHELGHFLMEKHQLTDATGFRCRSQDLRETQEGRQELKQETQANQFAIELMAPAPKFEAFLSNDPDLEDAESTRDAFDISLEASVRRMIDLRPETLAAVWSQNGNVRYHFKGTGFPWINRKSGSTIAPTTSAFKAISNSVLGLTDITEVHPITWTDTSNLEMWEQTRVGRDGHAVTLLWIERPDDDEAESDEFEELGLPKFR